MIINKDSFLRWLAESGCFVNQFMAYSGEMSYVLGRMDLYLVAVDPSS